MECNSKNMLALLDSMQRDLENLKNEWHRPTDEYIRGAIKQIESIRYIISVVWRAQ